MPGTPVSGRRGRFQINGFNANVEQWTVSEQTDIIDATSFEDQNTITGRTQRVIIDGIDQASISVKGYVDTSAFPASLGFTPGTDLTNIKLFINKAQATQCWTFTNAKVSRVNMQGQVRGRFEFDLVVENNGPYTRPS